MSTRKPMMAGNWKMYKTPSEAAVLVESIGAGLTGDEAVEVVVCPPFTALPAVADLIDTQKYNISLGAQNMHWESQGAFTGEISPPMLTALDIQYVILGHSERRRYFGDTDTVVNKKIHAAFQVGLKPIFCVGETREEREADRTREIIQRQVVEGLKSVEAPFSDKLIIAYEPIWAIGTGLVAEPEDANDVIRHIRAVLSSTYGSEAQSVRILYGGSVKPGNAGAIMKEPDIDGALIGGASLEAESFLQIVNYGA